MVRALLLCALLTAVLCLGALILLWVIDHPEPVLAFGLLVRTLPLRWRNP